MKKTVFFAIGILTAILTVAAGFTSCDQTSATAGRLIVNITDAPGAPVIEKIWLTITGVQVHVAGEGENDGEWKDLDLVNDYVDPADESKFELLELVNGSQAKLAVGYLDPGKYTQLRMDVKLVEIKVENVDEPFTAKLPSDVLKFVHPFEIVNGADTELLFDFDALKSVNETGNGKYIFKPVVKVTTINQPFQITTPSLFNGVVDVNYATPTLTANGGQGSYTWSLATGRELPANLSINAAGNITGIPTTAGEDYTFTIEVVDSSPSPKTATKTFSIDIAASGALQIITTYIPDGTVDVGYTATLYAENKTVAHVWSSDDKPAWMTISSTDGVISGIPTEPGDFSFTITLSDSAIPTPSTDTQVITLHINEAP